MENITQLMLNGTNIVLTVYISLYYIILHNGYKNMNNCSIRIKGYISKTVNELCVL